MVLMGVYSGGGMFTIPRLGVDGVLGVWFKFSSKDHQVSSFLQPRRANHFSSASSANFLACASSANLLASSSSVNLFFFFFLIL
jgi:hypothetical protein